MENAESESCMPSFLCAICIAQHKRLWSDHDHSSLSHKVVVSLAIYENIELLLNMSFALLAV